MATFDPIPYTYVPMAPRFKSTKAPHNQTPKQVSILDKIQRIKASSAALGVLRPSAAVAAANESRNDGPGIQKTSTVYGGNDGGDDDDDLPTIEDLLYTTLKKEGFATEDSSLDRRVQGVEEGAGSINRSGSVSGDSLGSSRDNPIVLLGDDESNASDSEVFNSNVRAESAETDAVSFSNSEITVNSRPLAPPSSLDGWYDIDDYPKTVQLAEGALTSNSVYPYNPFSRLSSELLHDHIDTHHARSEAATSHSAYLRSSPPSRSRESMGNQVGQEDRLHAGQSTADEREYKDKLVRPALNTNTFDKGERQQQEAEAEREVDKDDDEDDSQPQQRVNSIAAVPMTERVGNTHLSSKGDESARQVKRQRPLPYSDSFPEPSYDEAGSHNDGYSDDELNNAKAKSDEDDERPRPAKRKRSSSSYDSPTQWKHKNYLQYRSSRQRKLRSKSHQHHPKSHSLLYQGSRVAAGSSAEGQLSSLVPSALQATETDMSPDCCNSSPRDALPTLTEVTFRPHSLYCCSFTAVIRDGCNRRGVSFGQLAQLIESIGHMGGGVGDFTIKPVEHHSFLLTGFSRVLASRKSKPPNSDDDSGLSDRNPESSSDDDDGCSSEAERGHSSTSKRNRWSDLDEQRLLAYKKEGKSWDWIFGKFPSRTGPAIRTRWSMVRPRDK